MIAGRMSFLTVREVSSKVINDRREHGVLGRRSLRCRTRHRAGPGGSLYCPSAEWVR
jgi:hypothetical protein